MGKTQVPECEAPASARRSFQHVLPMPYGAPRPVPPAAFDSFPVPYLLFPAPLREGRHRPSKFREAPSSRLLGPHPMPCPLPCPRLLLLRLLHSFKATPGASKARYGHAGWAQRAGERARPGLELTNTGEELVSPITASACSLPLIQPHFLHLHSYLSGG